VSDPQDEPTHRHAHYLHRLKALEHLLALPVPNPRVLDWGEELRVATAEGEIWRVETDGGSAPWGMGLPEPVAMASQEGQLAQVARDGRMRIWEGTELQTELRLGLISQIILLPIAGGWVISGDDVDGQRQLRMVMDGGGTRARASLPSRTVVGVDLEGVPFLARSLGGGLWRGPIGEPVPEEEPTTHVLRALGAGRIVGLGHGGVFFAEGTQRWNLRAVDAAAMAWGQGDLAVLGTRRGELAAFHLGSRERLRYINGHKGPVMAISPSPKDNLLVSAGADGCRLWAMA
jgi:hypothetical protein